MVDVEEYAKNIGKQIAKSQVIYCPNCYDETLEGKPFKQPLSAVGDHEDELFCPHCSLTINIIVCIE